MNNDKAIEVLEIYQVVAKRFYAMCEDEKIGLTDGRFKFREDTQKAIEHAIKVLKRSRRKKQKESANNAHCKGEESCKK